MPTTIVRGPGIDERAETTYAGIRFQTPMKGMFAVIGKRFKELTKWLKQHNIQPAGPALLRYHVIDMEGEMDMEVCYPVAVAVPADETVKPGTLPAGRYASLIYIGNGYTGNKTLVEWAKANGIPWDRWDDPKGDAFRCRYEAYLTDPDVEPRKTKWEVEVAIKLPDNYTPQ